jgi:hypothetical protein
MSRAFSGNWCSIGRRRTSRWPATISGRLETDLTS